MLKKEKKGIVWFEFEKLQPYPHLKQAIFSRLGGTSKASFNSLNLSYTVGDEDSAVQTNRTMAYSAINLQDHISLVTPLQTHQTNVHTLRSKPIHPLCIPDCDALMTREKETALVIQHADCQAAIFYDPHHNAIACVHAGWRGSVGNIYKKTIQQMGKEFGSHPADLVVCISPSLGPKHAQFIHFTHELPEEFWPFKIDDCHFDFWAISRWQLENEGILRDHIEIANLCTYEDEIHFFSYRRDKRCGRHQSIVWLE